VSLENWISFVREGGSDDFFNTSSMRSIGKRSRVNTVAGNDSQLFRELSANCHSERSAAESKNPAKLAKTDATGFDSLASRSLSLRPSRPCRGFPSRSILDYGRNDVISFSRGDGV
jgi:hypothetical protein